MAALKQIQGHAAKRLIPLDAELRRTPPGQYRDCVRELAVADARKDLAGDPAVGRVGRPFLAVQRVALVAVEQEHDSRFCAERAQTIEKRAVDPILDRLA